MLKTSLRGILELASHEAIVLETYKDSVGTDTWSIGLTSATGHDVTRYRNNPSTLQHALTIFVWALGKYEKEVLDAFAPLQLKEHELAGALSFHWNTGAIGKAQWVKDFKEGNLVAARKNFLNYNKPPEIMDRRKAERDLFFDGKWSGDGKVKWYKQVNSNGTPNWSSGVRIDIRPELTRLLTPAAVAAPVSGQATPQPIPANPPPRPAPVPAKPRKSWLPWVIGAVVVTLVLGWAFFNLKL